MVALEHVDATQRRFVWLASVSYRAGRGLLEQNDDAQDLMVGTPRMGEILRHIGWEATAGTAWAFIAWRVLPASGALEEPHGNLRLIAASAAQPCEMRRDGDRHRSTNLSYVVDENWRGRGLGWLAVSAAFGRLAEAQLQNYGSAAPTRQPSSIVHAQVRSDNAASAALAASLGPLREQRAGFTVPRTERAERARAAGLEFDAWTGNAGCKGGVRRPTSNGRLVQVKATMRGSLTFPAHHVPDYYLGVLLKRDGTFEESSTALDGSLRSRSRIEALRGTAASIPSRSHAFGSFSSRSPSRTAFRSGKRRPRWPRSGAPATRTAAPAATSSRPTSPRAAPARRRAA